MQVIVHRLLIHLRLIDKPDIYDTENYNDVHVVHNLYNTIVDILRNFSTKKHDFIGFFFRCHRLYFSFD